MFHIVVHVIALALYVTLVTSPAWAAGAYIYENGTPDLGTAAAGRAALGQDASTVIGNPAGMTRLERSQLTGSVYTILPSMQFDRGSGTTSSGGNGFNAGAPIPSLSVVSIPVPAGSLFYVYSASPDVKLGVGVVSGYGGGLNYGKEWVGRYYVQKAQSFSFTINPGAAYRVNPWLSIGGGVSVNYSLLSQTAAVNNLAERLPDGRFKFKADDWRLGGNVGVLIEPSARLRFGVTYRSPIDFSYKDNIKFTNVGPGLRRALERTGVLGGETTLEQTAPQAVMASWYYALTDQLALMGNFGWQNWKEYGDVDVEVSSSTTNTRSVTPASHFQDTWHQAIGLQYRFSPPWLLSAGFAHDSAPVSKFHRTPTAPYDETFRYGAGLQYDWNERLTVGAAYEYLDLGDAEIANLRRGPLAGTLDGDYSSDHVHFIALNVTWKF
jgi:long-chain fatty acid transport protein